MEGGSILILIIMFAIPVYIAIKGYEITGRSNIESPIHVPVPEYVKIDFDVDKAFNNMVVWMKYSNRKYEYWITENALDVHIWLDEHEIDMSTGKYKFYIRAFDERHRDATVTISKNPLDGKYEIYVDSSGEWGYMRHDFPSGEVIYDHRNTDGVKMTLMERSCVSVASVLLYEFLDLRKLIRRDIFGYHYLEKGYFNDELYTLFKYAHHHLVWYRKFKRKDVIGNCYIGGNLSALVVYEGRGESVYYSPCTYFGLSMYDRRTNTPFGKCTLIISQKKEDIIEISVIDGVMGVKNCNKTHSLIYHVGETIDMDERDKALFKITIATLRLFEHHDDIVIADLNKFAKFVL